MDHGYDPRISGATAAVPSRQSNNQSPADAAITAVPSTAGASHYSTLEVAGVPAGDKVVVVNGPEQEKIVIHPAPDFMKEAVPQPYYSLAPGYPVDPNYAQQSYYDTQTSYPMSAWSISNPWGKRTGPDQEQEAPPPGKRETICGLKRRTFFIVLWVVSILVAIGIGVGTGVGVTMRSRSSEDSDAASPSLGAGDSSSSSAATTTTTQPDKTQSPTPSNPADDTPSDIAATPTAVNTGGSRTTISSAGPTSTPQFGGPGGRCVNEWGSDCICLDQGICVNRWRGTPYTGSRGNWPCPDDPDNIMACVVAPCLGREKPASCLWREACREVVPACQYHQSGARAFAG
ncbi:hypothetical protein VTJ49DRAFT_3872 [Mycothermus thermophilus]|uniref:Uncharacterized protein n=1 Tax=Humicola insolens TaxID=85995 RepID=A0ABR3VRN6_HUMIN